MYNYLHKVLIENLGDYKLFLEFTLQLTYYTRSLFLLGISELQQILQIVIIKIQILEV